MIFSPQQIEEILAIIDYYHIIFISENIGSDFLTQTDKSLLKTYGFDIGKVGKGILPIEQAYKFGVLSVTLKEAQAKNMTFAQFKKYLLKAQFMPLSSTEKEALNHLKHHAYSDIKGLGARYKQKFGQVVIEEDQKKRAEYEKLIQTNAEATIKARESISDLVSRLGNATQEWNRDFGRIADFIMHSAFDAGRAEVLKQKYGGKTLVYKDVFPGACKECIRLYTTGGVGSEPVIFQLEKIESNGNNIGRKAKDWLPVIGPTHPWCRCTLQEVPEDYEWDPKTGGFTQPSTKWKPKVARKSKVIIKMGNETYEV